MCHRSTSVGQGARNSPLDLQKRRGRLVPDVDDRRIRIAARAGGLKTPRQMAKSSTRRQGHRWPWARTPGVRSGPTAPRGRLPTPPTGESSGVAALTRCASFRPLWAPYHAQTGRTLPGPGSGEATKDFTSSAGLIIWPHEDLRPELDAFLVCRTGRSRGRSREGDPMDEARTPEVVFHASYRRLVAHCLSSAVVSRRRRTRFRRPSCAPSRRAAAGT